ncbi:phosphopantetheine-binding protein [Streptomyces sp. NPDC005303]|uniref:phosphopantetheine-binding protein n=1 Tax=Streptomyces sp. NPDC005303 TaxID=3155713 RepID=UPI0033BB3FCB
MNRPWDDRFERVLLKVIPGIPGGAELVPDLNLSGAGLTSIGIVQLMMQLEREYDVEFAFELLNFQIFATPATLWAEVSEVLAQTGRTVRKNI